MFASNPPAGVARPGTLPPGPPAGPPSTGLAPTPDLVNPASPPGTAPSPPDLQTGCGHPVRLRLWVPRLQEVFQYSHYEPVSAIETRMPVGMLQRFALPGGREMEIQPLGIRRPIVRVLVRIKRGRVGELATVMDVPPRRPAFIGGLPHQTRRPDHRHPLPRRIARGRLRFAPNRRATMPGVSERRLRDEIARVQQGHVKYRDKLRAEGKLFVRDRLQLLLDPAPSSRRTGSSRARRSRRRRPTASSPAWERSWAGRSASWPTTTR